MAGFTLDQAKSMLAKTFTGILFTFSTSCKLHDNFKWFRPGEPLKIIEQRRSILQPKPSDFSMNSAGNQ
jgi:hypothetical protein